MAVDLSSEKICVVCKKQFKPYNNQKTCSDTCSYKLRKERWNKCNISTLKRKQQWRESSKKRRKNPERQKYEKEYCKKYYQDNKEHIKERIKKWGIDNKDKISQRRKEMYERDYLKISLCKIKARINLNDDEIMNYLNIGCEDCGFKSNFFLDFHHIDENRANRNKTNIKYLCPNCHAKKHRRIVL